MQHCNSERTGVFNLRTMLSTIPSDQLSGLFNELINDLFEPAGQGVVISPCSTDGTSSSLPDNECISPVEVPIVLHLARPVVAKPTKKRRSSSGNAVKVKQLADQLQQIQTQLVSLVTDNIYLVARQEIMEQLLASKQRMAAREMHMKNGTLGWNPMVFRGTTVEELPRVCTPKWTSETTCVACASMAVLFANCVPLLRNYPKLTTKQVWQMAKPVSVTEQTFPPQLVLPIDFPRTALTVQQLHDLQDLARLGYESITYSTHAFVRYPKLLWVNGAHARVLRAGHGTWESFAGALGSGETYDGEPVIAPESHWNRVVRGLQLSDQQYLQCFVLWDICQGAKAAVTARRTALFQALTSLRAQDHQRTTDQSIKALWKGADQLDVEQDILSQLDAVSTKDRSIFFTALDVLLSHILSPIQFAMTMGSSVPYVPDIVAIIRAAALQCTQEVMMRLSNAAVAKAQTP